MINVQLGYLHGEGWEKLDWNRFRESWPVEFPEEKPKACPWFSSDPHRLTYDEINELTAAGAKIEIVPLPGAMIVKMQNTPHKWEYGTRIDGEALQTGSAVQIAVPDMALMYIDKVRVEEDCCTDNLQSLLDEGWRILAVCPPNSARRPDYILGRRTAKDPFDGS